MIHLNVRTGGRWGTDLYVPKVDHIYISEPCGSSVNVFFGHNSALYLDDLRQVHTTPHFADGTFHYYTIHVREINRKTWPLIEANPGVRP
jgi:hypothetical protein